MFGFGPQSKIISKGAFVAPRDRGQQRKFLLAHINIIFFGFCFDLFIILLSFGGPLYQK